MKEYSELPIGIENTSIYDLRFNVLIVSCIVNFLYANTLIEMKRQQLSGTMKRREGG